MECDHTNGVNVQNDRGPTSPPSLPFNTRRQKVTFTCADCGEDMKFVPASARIASEEELDFLSSQRLGMQWRLTAVRLERNEARRERDEALKLRDEAREETRQLQVAIDSLKYTLKQNQAPVQRLQARLREVREKLVISEGKAARLERAVKVWKDDMESVLKEEDDWDEG